MEHISLHSADYRTTFRLLHADRAVFTLACLLFAVPAFGDEPATAPKAALEDSVVSLEPPIDELREQIGKTAEVTFTVLAAGGRSNLYFNSQMDWRRPDCFTAMLVPEARDEIKKLGFDAPFDNLIGKKVRCRGKLELNRGQVRIVVHDVAKQLEIVEPESSTEESDALIADGTPEAPTAESQAVQPSAPPAELEPYVDPTIKELRASVGKERTVTFRVLNAGGRSHLYLNSQLDYRRPDCFTAAVQPAAVKDLASLRVTDARSQLIGKLVECRGTVLRDGWRLSIDVTDVKKQLRLVEESEEPAVEEPKPDEQSESSP